MTSSRISRRYFFSSTAALAAGLVAPQAWIFRALDASGVHAPLQEFDYGDVAVSSALHKQQLNDTLSVLMGLSDDSLLKPFRQMGGQPAPGEELGGWYRYVPDYDYHTFDAGFAPGATFGQWVSALARYYAINRDAKVRDKVLRLNQLYAKSISGGFYSKNRFPAYCFDKLVCGLMDSHRLAADSDAYRILEHTTDTAVPHLPGKAIEHGRSWRPGTDESYTWDESYTISENLFLAYQRGAGERYRTLAVQYLDDEYYDPLAGGRSDFAGRHAYSHVNSLCSAMQAYLTIGSQKHLRAATNAFDFLDAQSFATGGWGPDETLRAPDSDDVFGSLTGTHNSFETPCGAYAHFKLTRYLLRITRDPRYGDSMERVMYNTILGAKPLLADGHTFYYSDNNFAARKVYSDHRWPCCSGTMPQVATDYGINAYLREPRGIYVNLYIPSTLRWMQDGAHVSLTQKSSYPLESHIQFELTASRQTEFEINFRIPSWTRGASILVNGKRLTMDVLPGTFAKIRRQWNSGDRIELDLPLTNRLEPISARHPDTVALLSGPLVLLPLLPEAPALTSTPTPTSTPAPTASNAAREQTPSAVVAASPSVTRPQLLSAKKSASQTWQVETAAAPAKLLPFTAISDEQYSTYLRVR